MIGWPACAKSSRERDLDDHIDPDDYLPDCELEEQASKAEDAYARYVLGMDGDAA